jgi:hypothetical protein
MEIVDRAEMDRHRLYAALLGLLMALPITALTFALPVLYGEPFEVKPLYTLFAVIALVLQLASFFLLNVMAGEEGWVTVLIRGNKAHGYTDENYLIVPFGSWMFTIKRYDARPRLTQYPISLRARDGKYLAAMANVHWKPDSATIGDYLGNEETIEAVVSSKTKHALQEWSRTKAVEEVYAGTHGTTARVPGVVIESIDLVDIEFDTTRTAPIPVDFRIGIQAVIHNTETIAELERIRTQLTASAKSQAEIDDINFQCDDWKNKIKLGAQQ